MQCSTVLSRLMREHVLPHLTEISDEGLFDFVRNADRTDQDLGPMQYKRDPLYAHYHLPCAPNHYYAVTPALRALVLNCTGFAAITNVKIHSPFLRYLQDGQVYTTMLLNYIDDSGCASFDITHVAFNAKTCLIDFEPTTVRGQAIPAEHNEIFTKLVNALTDGNNYHYMHAYVLAYQQIAFLRCALNVTLQVYSASPVAKTNLPFPVFYDRPELLFNSQIIQIAGLAGTGKTYGTQGLYNSILACPTNELTQNFPARASATYHMIFGIGTHPDHIFEHYSNIILDEATMITDETFQIIKTRLRDDQTLIMLFDTNQLSCIGGQPIAFHPDLTLLDIRRSTDPCFIKKQERLTDLALRLREAERTHSNQAQNEFDSFLTMFCHETQSLSCLAEHYKEGDTVICSTHEQCDVVNNLLFPIYSILFDVPCYGTKRDKIVRRVPLSKWLKLREHGYHLGYGLTVHKLQGKSINKPLWINVSNMVWEPALLYTAISRVRSERLLRFFIDD